MIQKCKYFRTRKSNKKGVKRIYYYCSLLKKEVPFSCYQECDKKEYKEYKPIKKRSYKQSKKETKRFSVFYTDLSRCCVCGSNYPVTKHEIFEGRNRTNSIKYGFVLPLCLRCHMEKQEDILFNTFWKQKAQRYFEDNYSSREGFIKMFGRNYLK